MQAHYAFIGGGNMGRALIGGLIAAGHPVDAISVADSAAVAREACTREFGVAAGADNAAAVRNADVVVLAVKPQQLGAVARALADSMPAHALVVSIAAGITLERLAAWLGTTRPLVRAMPNTPALIGRGASALVANAHAGEAERTRAAELLGAVGLAVWLDDERQMDAVTALSGSGPAYYFLFIEHMEAAAVALGLPTVLARELALATAAGATALAAQSAEAPETLRQQVTSPGGTTERALASFAADDLAGIVQRALTAARDRSVELARQAVS
ncbi:MAG: pyrroline-5-carboxylate reductase [Gammaproteobacteria bacterium]